MLFAHADRWLQPPTGQVSAPALYHLACPAGSETTLMRDCLSAETRAAQRLILLASVPLTHEAWTPMQEGEVLAIRRGEIVASVQL